MAGSTNKEEIRAARRGRSSAAGSAAKELEALDKLQLEKADSQNAIMTITVGCTSMHSIICC